MKLWSCNKKALEQIIEYHPDDDMEKWTKTQQIEYLVNNFVHDYIVLMFENGKDYFRD